ncbi:MAG: TlyA family RNA methyltransferase [Acidobacteriaceae bacterium]|nr:TlyA family RNA methyltransferase [Acidobacteriaceae bacterium]
MKSGAEKLRLDVALVERNLVESREKAQALILAGKVLVDGQRADKPGRQVTQDSRIEVEQQLKYASRGGLKLEAALQHFGIQVRDKVCIDVGTSTGGFTDCLLQHGAARVHSVDTGSGQIHWRLRTDARVVLHERTNARYLKPEDIGEAADLIVCDVSFISVTLLLPALIPVLKPKGQFVILVKPQFEAGRELVGKGGIVRDPAVHALACEKVASALDRAGFTSSIIESPIEGAEGNREFLLLAQRSRFEPGGEEIGPAG